jgi:hypothetical protein
MTNVPEDFYQKQYMIGRVFGTWRNTDSLFLEKNSVPIYPCASASVRVIRVPGLSNSTKRQIGEGIAVDILKTKQGGIFSRPVVEQRLFFTGRQRAAG